MTSVRCTVCHQHREHHARGMCHTCYGRAMRRARARKLRVYGGGELPSEERQRDTVVRSQHCPVCESPPGERCTDGSGRKLSVTHDGRYRVAVRAGLVPALVGVS